MTQLRHFPANRQDRVSAEAVPLVASAMRFVASISDVYPRSLDAAERLAPLFGRTLDGPYHAMLVAPGHRERDAIVGHAAIAARLRALGDRGVEMFVQGWFDPMVSGAVHRGYVTMAAILPGIDETPATFTRHRPVGRGAELLVA